MLPPPTHSNSELIAKRAQTPTTTSVHDNRPIRDQSSTGGLTGPIYRREELIKKEPQPTQSQLSTNDNEVKVSRDHASARRRPSGKPTEMELFARAMTQV